MSTLSWSDFNWFLYKHGILVKHSPSLCIYNPIKVNSKYISLFPVRVSRQPSPRSLPVQAGLFPLPPAEPLPVGQHDVPPGLRDPAQAAPPQGGGRRAEGLPDPRQAEQCVALPPPGIQQSGLQQGLSARPGDSPPLGGQAGHADHQYGGPQHAHQVWQ